MRGNCASMQFHPFQTLSCLLWIINTLVHLVSKHIYAGIVTTTLTIISIFVGLARLFVMRAWTPWSQGHPLPPRTSRSCQKMQNAFFGGREPLFGSRTIFAVHPVGMHLPIVSLEILGYCKKREKKRNPT